MIAVVLVGGEGTRLRPLTLDEPKPVLPIGGVPFISLLLDRLAAAGVTRTILSCGYLPDRLRDGIGPAPWWVNAGAYVLDPAVLDLIPTGRMVSIEREVFPDLVGQGLFCVRSDGYWRDIGTLESFLTANADAIAGRVHTRLAGADVMVDPTARVADGARLRGPVLVGAGAVIGDDAEVGPDTVVGPGATIADGAAVRASVLLADAQVAAQAVVERSAIGRGALVGERARVTDSALGTDSAVVAGEQLSGERRPG